MAGSNEGVEVSPETLAALGARGIVLGLDIYDGSLPSRREPRDKANAAEWEGEIRHATKTDADAWLAMRVALWPDADPDDLRGEVTAFFAARSEPLLPHQVFVAEADGTVVGMLELSLRPYVDGCESSPVPYVEAWYVAPSARRQGVGGALMKAAEDWAIAHGHTEMGSDGLLENKDSERAHLALGFEQVERAIRFRKALKR
jgi:aminoglycoside 6'-N-acetyltransferase I